MNSHPDQTNSAEAGEATREQQPMPYDKNLAQLQAEKMPSISAGEEDTSDVPADENFVDDDVVEEGGHTT